MTTPPSAPVLEPPAAGRFGIRDQFFISAAWLGYNLQWGALLAVVLPHQIEAIVGPDRKEFFNGLVGPLGAVIALFAAPLSGALSDRTLNPMGRRRPHMLAGLAINCAFLLLIAGFGAGSPILPFILCYMGLQLGSNWLGGPYSGLIPDVVPASSRGAASGWMALMTAIGLLIGAVVAGRLIVGGSYWPAYGLILTAALVSVSITVAGVREKPLKSAAPFQLGAFLRSFWIDPKEHRNFYWVLITRTMVTMGVYSVFTFFQYFLGDVIGVSKADLPVQTGNLIGVIIAMGIPTSILAGALSDRYGRKPLVYLSGGIMALAATIFIAVAVHPSMAFMFAVAALFGIGNGAYQAVDWALAIDVLPGGEDAAKDMGIWHAALVLPQILAPFITGSVLTYYKQQSLQQSLLIGYIVVFVMTAAWFILGTVFVRQVRGVR